MSWLSVSFALEIAAFDLARRRLPPSLVRISDWATTPVLDALSALHSGMIGDYVAWVAVGLALFTLAFAFG
jgi:multicomponent Na+:H+ antiporter subunit D